MENYEGLWTVFFQTNFQTIGSGVVVFVKNRMLGGDASYYYTADVMIEEKKIQADIKVVRFNKAGMAIFGNLDLFNLKVAGDVTGNEFALHGYMVEAPNMKITVKGKKIIGI